ncbi:hypothetical protein HYN56_12790 [Flavobacterium crocinum]|uniref:Uncharacterized protein n=1 Tax=Flavobacterium crocinum TaxID=2183896 RepID=A0A2S1YLV2_9FLAO|nr:hypothetical protein HYN56_12790 [Flavobacterium crocinum]
MSVISLNRKALKGRKQLDNENGYHPFRASSCDGFCVLGCLGCSLIGRCPILELLAFQAFFMRAFKNLNLLINFIKKKAVLLVKELLFDFFFGDKKGLATERWTVVNSFF